MLRTKKLTNLDKKDLVYIPMGADKGDCPYCTTGVLRRDPDVEKIYNEREAYICARCGVIYVEMIKRYFKGLIRDKGLI